MKFHLPTLREAALLSCAGCRADVAQSKKEPGYHIRSGAKDTPGGRFPCGASKIVRLIRKIEPPSYPTPPLWPTGPYDIVYIDPPWAYDFARSTSRAIDTHYRSMSLEEVCALPLAGLAASNCILYMWITAPKILEYGPAVLEAWGFNPLTGRCWDKLRLGQGYWCRGEHELLVIARRGKFSPPIPANRPGSMIREKRAPKHSRKPDSVRDDILRAHPDTRRVEIFARDKDYTADPKVRFIPDWKPGWDAWGNEIHEKPVESAA